MPIEAGTTIADLDQLWPLSGDFVLEGDNHLRLIKAVLKAQFPGVGGVGFAAAITATEVEINYLSGATSNIQAQLDAITGDDSLIAPQGTVMPFYQVAPPTGWTQLVTENDALLRVVDSAGGGSGGTDSPISFDTSHTHTTGSHSLTISEVPSHNHTTVSGAVFGQWQADGGSGHNTWSWEPNGPDPKRNGGWKTSSSGGGASHNHGPTGSAGPTFTPKYVNIILASKD